jgi:hypothetical protein
MHRLIVIPALALSLLAAPASAQGVLSDTRVFAPDAYIPFLNYYLPRLPDIRATMLACFASDVSDNEPEEWEQAKAVITATLWAADFPAYIALSPDVLMHPDIAGTASGCDQVGMIDAAQSAAGAGWVEFVGYSLKAIGLEMIATPPTAENLAEVQALIAEETALTARLIACASVTAPNLLIMAAVDWNERLADALSKLARLGYPRPALLALAEAGDPKTFLDVKDWDATVASCTKDAAWYERVAMFNTGSLSWRLDEFLERTGALVQ